jgi:murein DD-endopeptidase MepM/ murein hydrolase activator NlpD
VFILGVVMMSAVLVMSLVRGSLAGGAPQTQDLAQTVAGASSVSPTAAAATTAGGPSTGGASAAPASLTPASAAPSASAGPPAPSALTGYSWPLAGAVVTLPFGPSPWGEFFVKGERFHDGLDIATQCGDRVRAAHAGTVLAAGRKYDDYMGWTSSPAAYYQLLDQKGWWNSLPIVIVIDDGNGYRSIYAHESSVSVKVGQKVKAGQIIGFEGATGNASGCHVHYGLFSPLETSTFELDPSIVAKDLMPQYEIARVDPFTVLPFRCDIPEMRTLRPAEATDCAPLPSATPSAGRKE